MTEPDWFRQDLEDLTCSYKTKERRKAFTNAVKETRTWIKQHPKLGNSKYSEELGIPGLRHKALLDKSFNILFFYIITPSNKILASRLLVGDGDTMRKLSILK
ncbi:hypothetical protein [Xanthomonas sp. MLO165]|uniref:hypothetical protein n=1 Tax=Xanthomonas sp. MLO165 TaxID=2081477 RepID=UPI001C05C537|nr:hypothetical protein [Xanthomonas sp. MLO165]